MEGREWNNYLFYRVYDIDFDSALHALKVLKRYKKNDVRFALLRDVIVTYACPFSSNKSDTVKSHSLPLKMVPKEQRDLHNELMEVRNQLFAHSDLVFLDPRVANWSRGNNKCFPMSFKGYDYEKLDARVGEIENLIRGVASNLGNEIDRIEDLVLKESKVD